MIKGFTAGDMEFMAGDMNTHGRCQRCAALEGKQAQPCFYSWESP